MGNSWIIYALLGVLVLLVMWRVASEWKDKSVEAANLRVVALIMGGIVTAALAWLFVRQ